MRVAIIGAGASGLAAACRIGERAEVVLFEHSDRVGKKILQTGAGRCNVMNSAMLPDKFICDDMKACEKILSGCEDRIKNFFEELGLVLREEDEGRIYPLTNQAASVLDVLRFAATESGSEIRTGVKIKTIINKGGKYAVAYDDEKPEYFDKIILACGGKAAPKTGSDGSGFAFARTFGHSVTPLAPVLVPLKSKSSIPRALKGTRCKCNITLLKNGKKVKELGGEIQFTEYGISGIAAMQISRYMTDGVHSVSVDLAPGCSREYIKERLFEARRKKRELQDILLGIVPRRVAQQIIKSVTDMSLTECSCKITDSTLDKIATCVKGLVLDIDGTLAWDNAQVTRGGVPLSQINPDTMESLYSEGLYIVGEMLDCDGDCGGYNLGWAWITAVIAADGCIGKGRKRNDQNNRFKG